MTQPHAVDDFPVIRRIAIRCGLVSMLLATGVVLSLGAAYADVLKLTSSAIPDNGTLATVLHGWGTQTR